MGAYLCITLRLPTDLKTSPPASGLFPFAAYAASALCVNRIITDSGTDPDDCAKHVSVKK